MHQYNQSLLLQNNELKVKYKKALNQLMHIVKINNSLKEHMDKNNQILKAEFKGNIENIKSQHNVQIQKLLAKQKDLKQVIQEQMETGQRLRLNINSLENEVSQLKRQLSQIQFSKSQSKKDVRSNQQLRDYQNNTTIHQEKYQYNQDLKNKMLQLLQQKRIKMELQQQITALKQKQKQMDLQLINLKQKYRIDILKKDEQNLKLKESEETKLSSIKSKFDLVQNELNAYKNSQVYYQLQVKPLFDYEQKLENVRQQFQKMNQNLTSNQEGYSKNIAKLQQGDRSIKIIYLQAQNQNLIRQVHRLNQLVKQLQMQRINAQKLQQQFKKISTEKQETLQSNSILQSLLITHKYRDLNNENIQRIKQFQGRIKLIIQQNENIEGYGGYHQITILKAYIIQLAEQLKHSKKKQQQLRKKNQIYKNQLAQAQKNYNLKIAQFNKRIINYDSLINKLYTVLEQKIKSNTSQQAEKEFSNAIRHYQEKMILMSQQIILLRKTNQQLLAKEQNRQEQTRKQSRIQELQQENRTYRKLATQLKGKTQNLQSEYNNLSDKVTVKINELQRQINQKDHQVQKLMVQNQNLINENNKNYKNMELKILDYQHQIVELRKQANFNTNKPNSPINYQGASGDSANKTDYPQFQLFHKRSISIQSINSNNNEDQIKMQNLQIAAQASQIRQLKQYINQLQRQIQKQRADFFNKNSQAASVIELQRQTKKIERQKNQAQSQLQKLMQKFRIQQAEWKQDIENLRYQNRGLIQQLSSKQNELMVYYDSFDKSNNFQQKRHQQSKDIQEAYQIIDKLNAEIKELKSQIITLRTNNISMKNELQSKEDIINQLKHQIFKAQLQTQKAKSSGSILKESQGDADVQNKMDIFGFSKNKQRNTLFENISMQDSIEAPANQDSEIGLNQKVKQNAFKINKNN